MSIVNKVCKICIRYLLSVKMIKINVAFFVSDALSLFVETVART